MNKQRPVNLDLKTIKFPPTAIVSILHRISGVILFLLLPVMLWGLHLSLSSEQSFNHLAECFASPITRIVTWVFVAGLLFHLIAGIRHLIMDLGFGESISAGRKSAYVVFALGAVATVIAGVILW